MKAGWAEKRLESIGDTQTGSTPKTSEKENFGDFIAFIKPADFNEDGSLNYINDGLSEIGLQKSRCVNAGSVLMVCIGATIGKCGWNDRDVTTNQQINVLTPFNNVSQKFVYYQMLTEDFQQKVLSNSSQATLPIINKSKWSALTVCIPPTLTEQQRIVSILDEVFDGIATAKTNAEKNLQNARALFDSHLQSVFSQQGEGWVESRLGTVYDVRDGTHDSPKYHETGYPLVTSKNLKREGLSFDDVSLINEQDYVKINQRSAVHKGDVLFAMIGTIGNPTLVTVEPNFAIKNVALFKIPNGQSGAFLKHYLASGWVISKLIKDAKGTTQKFVGLGYLRDFPINVPLLAKQLEVVAALDELAEETQRLETIYQQKLAALDALKKSLLDQAFKGQLVTN